MQKPWGSSLCYKLEADLETNLSKPIDITSWLAVYIGIFFQQVKQRDDALAESGELQHFVIDLDNFQIW